MKDILGLNFLKDNFIIQANSMLKLPEEAISAFIKSYKIIRNNQSLCKLLLNNNLALFDGEIKVGKERQQPKETFELPYIEQEMGKLAGMYPAVLLLSGLDRLMKFYKRRSIPQNIIVDTLNDIDIWMKDYYDKHGVWGLDEFWWLCNHFSGKLFRLGRLQFMHEKFSGGLMAFRNIQTSKVIALSEEGIRYRSDGQVDGTNGIYDREGSWISKLLINKDGIKGNPISPFAFAKSDFIELDTQQWVQVLSKGSPILETHIPAGEKLSHEACGESFKMSVEFFTKYFPELNFDGYVSSSWLFDSQLQKILLPSSNIVKFQREFYLYPLKASDFQTFERVFGGKLDNVKSLKAKSSLQKAILDYINEGNHMRQTAMFLLKDDLKYWGEAFYQTRS